MNNYDSSNYVFENEVLRYESYIKDFTDQIYKEFNTESKKLIYYQK